jgi:hypothetical protein
MIQNTYEKCKDIQINNSSKMYGTINQFRLQNPGFIMMLREFCKIGDNRTITDIQIENGWLRIKSEYDK